MTATAARGRLRLGVNIDHVATVRNARGGSYPDPVRAARLAEAAGADVFLVPRGEMSDADDAGRDLAVYGVDHLSQALQALRATG